MAAGINAACDAAVSAGEGAENGAAIVNPRDGRVSEWSRPATSAKQNEGSTFADAM